MKRRLLILAQALIITCSSSMFAQNGLNFDGTNDYVQTTSTGVLGTTNRTFEAWVYTGVALTTNACIMDYGVNAVGSRNTFILTTGGGLSYISGGTNANIGSTAGVVPIGQWTHVAFVLNNGTGFFYVNGIQVGTGSLTAVNTPSGTPIRIGERVSGGSLPFKGIIDELRVWNVAKTPAELMTYMNNELCGTPAGLFAYFKFNQGIAGGANSTVTTAINGVPSANGTLTNFALTGATSNWVTGKTLGAPSVFNSQTFDECPGFTVTVGSNTYGTTGIYADTLVGASQAGCDSIIITNLTVAPQISVTQTLNECPGYSITVGNNTYNTSGNYIDTLFAASINGCDSIVNTNLNIAAAIINNQTLNECAGASVTIGNNTYTTSGNYVDTLFGASSTGCDSIVNTNLTFAAAIITNQTFSECAGFSITVGSNTYSSTGNYIDTLIGASSTGCDSIVNTNLTIASAIDITVVNAFLTLTANQTGASYIWLDCDNLYAPIAGATSQSFTATANGNYAVEITVGSCVDTSLCSPISEVGINELNENVFSIFPNPTKDILYINGSDKNAAVHYILTSVTGNVIAEKTAEMNTNFSIDLSKEANGVYFLKLNDFTYKVIKK